MSNVPPGPLEERVSMLVLEYAEAGAATRPLNPRLSLRHDLGIDSLSLVSLAVRLGDELGVEVAERGAELGQLETVADLCALARSLTRA